MLPLLLLLLLLPLLAQVLVPYEFAGSSQAGRP
jgi:hypothetical protein